MNISDRTLRRTGSMISAASIASAPIAMTMMAVAGVLDQVVENFSLINAVVGVCYGVLGLALVRTEPRNKLVWFFIAIGFCSGFHEVVNGVVELIAADQGVHAEEIDTSGWPPGVALLTAYTYSIWVFQFYALPTLGLLLAPNGRLPSRRWLPVAIAAAITIPSNWVIAADRWPIRDGEPPEDGSWIRMLFQVNFVILCATFLAALVSLVLRYRRSDGSTQRRLRWVMLGSASYLISIVVVVVLDTNLALFAWYTILPVCYGLAIWRDQLFDVDIVISRTLVYASTLAVIATIYVTIVFGLGTLVGQASDDGSPVLPILATIVIAVAFHPARQRLERLANRIVFGRRATPYEVLSEFTQRVAATDDQLLTNVARSVADGTVATGATVWALSQGTLDPVSVWPHDHAPTATVILERVDDTLIVPGADRTYPIVHHDEVIGALGLTLPASESLPPGDQALVDELIGGIGLALWNRELSDELRSSVDDLRASRRRLVAVQDQTRHRLERDLHDGAIQSRHQGDDQQIVTYGQYPDVSE